MPMFTPSRFVVLAISLSLFSFLWVWGVPRQLPQPGYPIVDHNGPQAELEDWQKERAAWEKPVFEFDPEQSQGLKKGTQSTQKPTPTIAFGESATPKAKEGSKQAGDTESEKPTAALYPSGSNGTAKADSTSTPTPTPSPVPIKFCKDVHGAPNVMVIIKTSKAEIAEKIPTHLKTVLECVPNFAIFSDHAGKVEGFTIHDALDQISNSTRTRYKEFREYEKLQTQKADDLKPGSVTKDLDKWKILPMVYRAYKMRPYSRFYIFIEADTSLSWTNLLQWMARLDYRIPYYAGAPTFLGSVKFAQRGPGILLSNGALRQYAKAYDERYESEWEPRVGKECCGDMVLATAMTESHVEFYSAFPLLQGETPNSLDWTDRHWCAPIVSWHHMSKEDIEMVWGFQKNWTSKHGWEEPYLIKNAFAEFVSPHLAERKDDWDNFSQDTKIDKPPKADTEGSDDNKEWLKHGEDIRKSVESPDNCRRVCELAEDCVQWKYMRKGTSKKREVREEEKEDEEKGEAREGGEGKQDAIKGEADNRDKNEGGEKNKEDGEKPEVAEKKEVGECVLGKVIKLGKKMDKKEGEQTWTSGWMVDRIKKMTSEWECKEPSWKFNQ